MHFKIKVIAFLLAGLYCSILTTSADPGLKYIENKGQWPKYALYGADIPGGNAYLRKDGFSYLFYDTEALHKRHEGYEEERTYLPAGSLSEESCSEEHLNLHLFNTEFINGNSTGLIPLSLNETYFNYFYGRDPDQWVRRARAYERIVMKEMYSDIDIITYSQGFNMKYDVIIKEGGDPGQVRIRYNGLENMRLSKGSLFLETSVNQIQEYEPLAYQVIDGKKTKVVCEYVLEDNILSYSFPFGYDSCYELVIDPILIFSTYSGSPADNWGNTATYGENGTLYSGGITNHFRGGEFLGEFSATEGAYQTSWGGIWDVAILKYDSSGRQLEYATYLGGGSSETPHSLIVNKQNELIIFGTTSSTDFPVTSGAYGTTFFGGQATSPLGGVPFDNGADFFIAKLNASGTELTASSFVGGSANDGINPTSGNLTRNYGDQQKGEVYLDESDNIYFVGSTSSTDMFEASLPSFQNQYHGGLTDAVVVKMNGDLSSLLWGGYLGGSGTDAGFSLRVDTGNQVYAAGGTESPDFTAVGSGLETDYQGSIDGWICKISTSGLEVENSTFLGTGSYDQTYFIDLDREGNVYALGQTEGSYLVTSGVYNNANSGHFIHKLTPDLSTTVFSTTFGVTNDRSPKISFTAFLVNDCSNLYVAGWGSNNAIFQSGFANNYINMDTRGMPTTADALRSTSEGSDFYLMVLDDNGSELLYGTFFGGENSLLHVDGGTSRFDKRGIVYQAVCASCNDTNSSFPTTVEAWSVTNGADGGCNNAAFKFDLASLRARIQTNTVAFDQPGIRGVCFPDDIVFQNLSVGGEVYEWDFGDGNTSVKTDTTHIIHNYQQPGAYTVVLKAIDPNTCIGEDVASLAVNVYRPAVTVSDDTQVCAGDSFTLEASGGVAYQWVSADSSFVSNERTPEVAPEDTTQYFVTVTGPHGCQVRDTVLVEVIPQVDMDFEVIKLHDCFSRPPVKFINKSKNGEAYQWSLGDGNVSDSDELTHEYEEDGGYEITLTGSREFCVYKKSVNIKVVTIRVPNVLTPSVKGHNDRFEIIADTQVDLKIFNRWGKLIYEQDDYRNEWDGEGQAGSVYYYEAAIKDEVVCKGWLHLLR